MTKLDVYIVLDRSGSMASNWVETVGSINGYVEGLQKNEIEGTVTVIAFDDAEPRLVLRDKASIPYWKTLKANEILPRGGTPLYDALGFTLTKAAEANNEKVAIVVVTDGMENSSREFTLESIKKAIDKAKEKGWEVLFLSADLNFNAEHYTRSFGMDASKFINTSNATRNEVMGNLAMKSATYARTADVAAAGAAMSFTVEEKNEASK